MQTSERYMRRCLELAELAKGFTAPNPMVGALLVHEQRIIGEGWHRKFGEAHAEVNCIYSVKAEDKHLIPQSTMYVSLEPCAHHGKTPPCAERIIQEKIKKVVICNVDPFEAVSGKGMELLKQNGVEVETGILAAEGKWLNRRFFCFHQNKRPYIMLKWAETLEGRMAPQDRSRRQLSNAHSMQLVHKWRTEEAAIMIGHRTAVHDNPKLTARYWKGRQPLRVVLDRNSSLSSSLNLFSEDVPTLRIASTDPKQILEELYQKNITSVMIEGGAATLKSFISQGLWDEARIFRTPVSLPDGIPAPRLTNSKLLATIGIESDRLEIFSSNASSYPYVNGLSF